MRPVLVFLLVATALVAAVNAQDRRLFAVKPACCGGTGDKGDKSAYNIVHTSSPDGKICFQITTGSDCDSCQACCPKGAAKPPKFKSLLLTPPPGSSCANKGLQAYIKWTVGTAAPIKGTSNGAVITVKLSKLDPASGGTVCADLSGVYDSFCSKFTHLCPSDASCNVAVKTLKYKNAAGKSVDCCCGAYGPRCSEVPCAAPRECEVANACDTATNTCVPTFKADGAPCKPASGLDGLCDGRGACEQIPVTSCVDTASGTTCKTAGGEDGACIMDACVAGGVTDCAGQAGDKVLCTSDTVRYGWCCTPERIRTQACAYTGLDTCIRRYTESCADMPDLMLCGCSDYISFCKAGACARPVADCRGKAVETPCQYGSVPIIGMCSSNACFNMSLPA